MTAHLLAAITADPATRQAWWRCDCGTLTTDADATEDAFRALAHSAHRVHRYDTQ